MGVLADKPLISEPWICRKCTGVRGAHYLTCPLLRLPPGWWWGLMPGDPRLAVQAAPVLRSLARAADGQQREPAR